ncbi:MAG: ABC1 kinase family protein [Actinomycetes bacterium]
MLRRRWPVAAGLVAAAAAVVVVRRRSRRPGAAPVPVVAADRARRTATLARVGAGRGTDLAVVKVRGLGASAARRAELQAGFELRTAEQVAETLGGMKGALMKLGQMASYLDQGLPEPVRAALAELQADAPPMSADLAAEVVRAELGADPDVVFAEWDPHPLAAASIGQVHRAVTHDGTEVAVKVQYPGVDTAVASDLENTDLLFTVMGMLFPGLDPRPVVDELRERLVEELDYRAEAAHQRMFVAAYRDHPFISVPEVVDAHSTGRVLTTTLAHGAPFSEVVGWDDDQRQLAAECLYRFAFGGIYRLGAFNGDPHPGNYLFGADGRVTFLDFGLCKRFAPDELQVFEDMIQAMVLDHDVPAFRRVVERVGILPEGADLPVDVLEDYFTHFYELVMEDRVVEVTPEYSSASVRRFFDLGGPYAEVMKQANLPPSMVIIQRINLGLYALFGDLRARANWRQISEEIWPFTDGPPSTPMGVEVAAWERSARPG